MKRMTIACITALISVFSAAASAEPVLPPGSLFSRTLLQLDAAETPASAQIVAYLARAEQSGGGAHQESVQTDGFIDNGDGSITDVRTGLIWLGDAGKRTATREKAAEYCSSIRVGGHADWRLPTEKELNSLLASLPKNAKLRTALSSQGFVSVGDLYWTHIKDAPFEDFLWSVDAGFSPMTADRKHNNYVWPVRTGKAPASK